MTFLELCVALRREVDVAGSGPTTVIGQTGQLENFVAWIKGAWVNIQSDNGGRWRWLRRKFTVTTVSGTGVYGYTAVDDQTLAVPIDRFNIWRLKDRMNPPRIYKLSAGSGTQTYLSYLSWDQFEGIYARLDQNPGQPHHISVDPQDNIVLGPTPNDAYVVLGEYYRGPQTLMADDDEPEIQPQFHEAIIFKAMIEYGYQQVSQESLQRADVRLTEMLGKLELRQSESLNFRTAGPLA